MKTAILKYWRLSEDKKALILLPSKIGIDILKRSLAQITFTETVEKLDKVSLIAIRIDFSSGIKFLEYKIGLAGANFYIFCMDETKTYITFPYEL